MDVSKELIRSIVEKVLAESAGTAAVAEPYKEKDPSGIIKITTDKVKTERFEQDGVYERCCDPGRSTENGCRSHGIKRRHII